MAGATLNRGNDDSLGELFGQLIDDAGQVVRAELNVYRETVLQRIRAAQAGLALLVLALLLGFAAIGAFVVMVAVALTPALGPLGAGALVAIVTLAIAGLLAWLGVKRLANVAAGRGVAEQ